jgi:hypothetical protein
MKDGGEGKPKTEKPPALSVFPVEDLSNHATSSTLMRQSLHIFISSQHSMRMGVTRQQDVYKKKQMLYRWRNMVIYL